MIIMYCDGRPNYPTIAIIIQQRNVSDQCIVHHIYAQCHMLGNSKKYISINFFKKGKKEMGWQHICMEQVGKQHVGGASASRVTKRKGALHPPVPAPPTPCHRHHPEPLCAHPELPVTLICSLHSGVLSSTATKSFKLP